MIFRFGMKSRSGNDYRSNDLNSYISLTHSVRCIVPPKIRGNEDEAEKLMALVDTSVNIECKAMGTPPPQINWLKNGLPLPLSSHIRLLSAGQVVRLDCIVCHFLSAMAMVIVNSSLTYATFTKCFSLKFDYYCAARFSMCSEEGR